MNLVTFYDRIHYFKHVRSTRSREIAFGKPLRYRTLMNKYLSNTMPPSDTLIIVCYVVGSYKCCLQIEIKSNEILLCSLIWIALQWVEILLFTLLVWWVYPVEEFPLWNQTSGYLLPIFFIYHQDYTTHDWMNVTSKRHVIAYKKPLAYTIFKINMKIKRVASLGKSRMLTNIGKGNNRNGTKGIHALWHES